MDETNLMTAEGCEALNAELAALEGEGRREIAERIKTAREWGDLKENSEYHDAKNDQAHLETKIARLRERIAAAVIVEDAGRGGVVGFGSIVACATPTAASSVADRQLARRRARRGRLGRIAGRAALLGLVKGDSATVTLPRGERVYAVLDVG